MSECQCCHRDSAIVFDFDGTLIETGHDKGIHLMYAAWVACYEAGWARALHPDRLEEDVERLWQVYAAYHGGPRFQQLNAFVNVLLNHVPQAVSDVRELALSPEDEACYPEVRTRYDEVYSALNEAAANTYWRPFLSIKEIIHMLVYNYDLFIASGLPQKLVEEDVETYGFHNFFFKGVFGSDLHGRNSKGEILAQLKQGYEHVLFVGDSPKDLAYALEAGVKFFRIQEDADFWRLVSSLPFGMPHEPVSWTFTPEEIRFLCDTTVALLRRYVAEHGFSPQAVTDTIHR